MNRPHVLLAAAVSLAASTSQAAWPTLSGSVGYESQFFTSGAYDLVDTNDWLPMLRVGVGTAFPLGRFTVDVGASFTTGASREAAHGALASELWLRGLELGGTLRYPVFRWLEPYAHLGLGWDWATLTLFEASRLSQTVSNVSGSGLLGVQLPVRMGTGPGRAPFMVFDVGGGYVLRPDYAFDGLGPAPVEPTPDGPEPIANGKVNVGKLPLHGALFRVLVTLRW